MESTYGSTGAQSTAVGRAEFYYPNRKERWKLMVILYPLLGALLNVIIIMCNIKLLTTLPNDATMMMVYAFGGTTVLALVYSLSFYGILGIEANETVYVRLKADGSYWRIILSQFARIEGIKLPGVNMLYIKNPAKLSPDQKEQLEGMLYTAIVNSSTSGKRYGPTLTQMGNVTLERDKDWYRKVSYWDYRGARCGVNVAKIFDGLSFGGERPLNTKRLAAKSVLLTVVIVAVLSGLLFMAQSGQTIKLPQNDIQKEQQPKAEQPQEQGDTEHTVNGVTLTMPKAFTAEDGNLFFNAHKSQMYTVAVLTLEDGQSFSDIVQTIQTDAQTVPGFVSLNQMVEDSDYGNMVDAKNAPCQYNLFSMVNSGDFVCHQGVLYWPDTNQVFSIMGAAGDKKLDNDVKKQTQLILLSAYKANLD